ncbi:MAG: FHA domain-containing protein, partial [Deltaproteobacteria bacterium]|nr:FHA domain-containing protein [Deltaproteobacteria bacterium]
ALRLSANLNKVSLSIRRYGYLLEDKNYRNALLVNRRRVRRTMLRDGDVLDLGDLTLLYRDNRLVPIVRHSPVTPPEGKVQLKFERLRGPVRKGMAMLVPEQFPNRIYYMSKNKIYIGRSEECDLILKAQDVYYHHAKIERVGGRYKLQDLTQHGNTFVNNRRVEQRYLKEGDEISIESHRFKFQFATKAVRERFVRSAPVLEDVEADRVVGEAGYGEEDSTELSAD